MLIVQPVLVAALFVTSYPYLWSAPIERTRILFDFRRFEMNNQAGLAAGGHYLACGSLRAHLAEPQ